MKIHVVGAGVVGLATSKAFARFGHQVVYSDIDPHAIDRVAPAEFGVWAKDGIIPEADVHFVCVPEDAASNVVRMLKFVKGAIVIRSSVPPGTTAKLAEELKRPLWHNPEFLREATAEQDVLWAKHTLIGWSTFDITPENRLWQFREAYEDMGVEVIECTSTESELVKLFTNTYLATLISLWNENKLLCDALGVNSHKVARMVALDERVSKYGAYMHGAPYGGKCLPKDVAQVLKLAQQQLGNPPDIATPLLYSVQLVNKRRGGE